MSTPREKYYNQEAWKDVTDEMIEGNIEEHRTYNDVRAISTETEQLPGKDHPVYTGFVYTNVFISSIQPALNSIAAFASMFLGGNYAGLSVSDFKQLMSALIEDPKLSPWIWVFAIGALGANFFIGMRFLSSTIKDLYKEIIPYAFKEAPLDIFRFIQTGTTRKQPLTEPLLRRSLETPPAELSVNEVLALDEDIKLIRLPMRRPASLLAAFFGGLTLVMYLEMSLEALTMGRSLLGAPWGAFIDWPMIFANTSVNTATRISGTVMLLSTFELWLPAFYIDYLLHPISTKSYSDSMRLYPELRNALLFFHHLKCYAPYLPEKEHWRIVRLIEHNKFQLAAKIFYQAIKPLGTDLSFTPWEPRAWPRLSIKMMFFTVSILAFFLFYNIVDRATQMKLLQSLNNPYCLPMLVFPSVCYYFITLGRNIDLLLSSYQWHKRAAIHQQKKGWHIHAHALSVVFPAIMLCLLSAGNLLYVGKHDALDGDYEKFGLNNKKMADGLFSTVGAIGSSVVNFYSIMTILNKQFGPKPIPLEETADESTRNSSSSQLSSEIDCRQPDVDPELVISDPLSEILNPVDQKTVTTERHEDSLAYLKSLIGSTERGDHHFRENSLWYTQKMRDISDEVSEAKANHS